MGKISIVPFDMEYLEDYYRGFSQEIVKYQWPDTFDSIDDARAVLQDFMDEMKREETLLFSVVDENGKFVGSVEMHGLSEDCPELGVWILEQQQGKGYAFEALNYVLDLAREKYGKRKFFYEADIRNEGSNKLLGKLSGNYEITRLETEELVTDSGKELKLRGNILEARHE
ncbi:N-acetyltransferase [Butyrivibrio sp. CB08]|uniref:GNAT family N-acetyltransferase n=1 Tax=Butyrivibrio sp. CB08 TaxID=2364879 RepID=UPI000EA87EFD|nr:GNAT family N-acetyltransferase [Butyrivibrio sp. CB08]RKM59309.1 N-acetyltransferase [Butyrivibrio sp. CB08]